MQYQAAYAEDGGESIRVFQTGSESRYLVCYKAKARQGTIDRGWVALIASGGMKGSTCVVGLKEALTKGPPPPGNLAVPIFSDGPLEVELYTPRGEDRQKPHTRDELYFVARGAGLFFNGTERIRVEPGSFIFVRAGQEHRFEDFSSDFAVWVVFYGHAQS